MKLDRRKAIDFQCSMFNGLEFESIERKRMRENENFECFTFVSFFLSFFPGAEAKFEALVSSCE